METKVKIQFLIKSFLKVIRSRIIRYLKKRKRGERIRLAVVGSTSSGKSFLLMDIIQSLKDLGYPPYDSSCDDYDNKDITDYKPNEKDGYGGTPPYAARQDNIYVGDMGKKGGFSLDFMNIPGETFSKLSNGRLSPVTAYDNLKRALLKNPKRMFRVLTYMEKDSGEIKLIVEPWKTKPISSGETTPSNTMIPEESRRMSYLDWNDIMSRELMDFELVKGWGMSYRINGKTLLKNFFDYQTDSVIMSIRDLIQDGYITDIGFNEKEFSATYNRAFVFLQYCASATDIVVCERIIPSEDKDKELPFAELTNGIGDFIDKNNNKTQVYLAFRCIDYMLYRKENKYIELEDSILKKVDREKKRNAIYSIFHYGMLHHINGGLQDSIKNYEYYVGLNDIEGFKKEKLLSDRKEPVSDFIKEVADEYVDFDGCKDSFGLDAKDMSEFFDARFGGIGNSMAFRGLLQKAGVDALNKEVIPHVYFTCTPITSDYKIYKNYSDEQGKMASDFKRIEIDADGQEDVSYFREQNSQACFGSFQLCMDILRHHEIGKFQIGSLLRCVQDVSE